MACLSLGADGMVLATRMIVSTEVWAHRNYKQHLAELGAGDTRLIMNIFGDSSRVLSNASSDRVLELEATGITDYEAYRPHVEGPLQKEAYEDGDWTKGTASIGQSVAFAREIEPVETIIDGIIAEAVAVRARLNGL
jgi:nitronate monooxygenase